MCAAVDWTRVDWWFNVTMLGFVLLVLAVIGAMVAQMVAWAVRDWWTGE